MTKVELEWHLMYALVVAGKSAKFANAAIGRLRSAVNERNLQYCSIFSILTWNLELLRAARTGRYKILERAVKGLSSTQIDLKTCFAEELERIPGIGPKTSRFFVAWTRPESRVAILDRHVLRWMRDNGYNNAPENNPGNQKQYARLERAFLEEADKRKMTPRELDLEIWTAVAKEPNVVDGRINLEGVKL